MAKILRPRRGTASVAKSQLTGNNKLASGEVFFELPDGKSWGGSEGKIIMGNGTSEYSALTPFIDPTKYVHTGDTENQGIQFTETSSTDNAALLKTIASGVSIKNAFAGIKNLLSNLNSSVTQLNNDIGYHWTEIGKKISIKDSNNMPLIAIAREYVSEQYTINNNSSKWMSITHNSTYSNDSYYRMGAIGVSIGAESSGNPNDCSVGEFSENGIRLRNQSGKAVTIKKTNSSTGATSPSVDVIYIRKDIIYSGTK